MSIIATALRHMLAAGMDHDAIVEAVAAMECEVKQPVDRAADKRREWDRDRKRKQRNSVVSGGNPVEYGGRQVDGTDLSSPSGSSPKPLSPNPHQSIPPSPPKGGSSPAGFEEFWEIYPNKVGKRDAEKSFVKALSRAMLPEILSGLRRYVAKTDDRPWCNPATWLNQDRWADAPAAPVPRQQAPPRERTIFDAIDDFTGRHDHELSAGTTIDHDGGDYSPNVHLLASPSRR